jgi:spore maturation protein CgeB
LKDLGAITSPLVGFVGDHYDFLDDAPRSRIKQEFFRNLGNLVVMVSAYPHTNIQVATSLGRPDIPFIYLPWAISPAVFRDLGKRRRYDIACLGALTEGKYPLRRKVRAWIENDSGLRYIRKKRIGGHDGEQFNAALNTTCSAFTCASAMRYTLMKYFEIPASGALMFGEPTPELAGLGFRDGEHYVAVDEDNFAERIAHYTSASGRQEGERIRRAGHDFVIADHTWEKRIPPFLTAVDVVLR